MNSNRSDESGGEATGGLRTFISRHRRVLLLALAVRLAIMPFFAAGDLAADMWRAYELVFREDATHVTNMAWTRAAVGVVGIGLAALATPDLDELMPETGISIAYFDYDLASYLPFWSALASQPRFMLAQFLFKCVYLPFDLLIAFLLARLCRDRERLAVRLWLLNPIAIFASYMWGRFDVVMAAFVLAALALLAHRRAVAALGCVVMAGMTKAAVILLAPLIAAICLAYQRRGRGWTAAAIGLAFAALSWWPPFRETVRLLAQQGHTGYLLETSFTTHHLVYSKGIVQTIFLLPAFLFLVAITAFRRPRERLAPAVALSFLGYYILCHYHPHYLVWVVPFLIVVSIHDRQLIGLLRLQGIVFGLQYIALQGLTLWLPALPTIHGDGQLAPALLWKETCLNLWRSLPELSNLLFTMLFAIHVLFIARIWWNGMRDGTNALATPS